MAMTKEFSITCKDGRKVTGSVAVVLNAFEEMRVFTYHTVAAWVDGNLLYSKQTIDERKVLNLVADAEREVNKALEFQRDLDRVSTADKLIALGYKK